MSAWIVTKAHIDALVTAAVEFKQIQPEQADEAGALLWRENYKSVNYRYGEKKRCPAYHFHPRINPLTIVEVCKSIACLDYQSCEHAGWDKSEAKKFLLDLQDYAVRALPGWDNAPWGIDG